MLRVLIGASVLLYTLVCHISRAKVFFYRKNIHTFTEVVGQEHISKNQCQSSWRLWTVHCAWGSLDTWNYYYEMSDTISDILGWLRSFKTKKKTLNKYLNSVRSHVLYGSQLTTVNCWKDWRSVCWLGCTYKRNMMQYSWVMMSLSSLAECSIKEQMTSGL